MGPGEPFLIGLDYRSPGWLSFDHRLLEQCLARTSSLGLAALRLPLTWADFQPDPHHLSDRCLRDLEAAMNTAAAYGLGVIPVFLSQGGTDSLLPTWVSKGGEEVLEGQLHLLKVVASYFRGHRALRAWELDARSAREPGLVGAWREVLVPAARHEDSRHHLALGLRGDELLRGDRSLLEGLAPLFSLMVLDWSGPAHLAPAACALAWALVRRRTLVLLAESAQEGLAEALAGVHQAGGLGVLLATHGQERLPEGCWDTLARSASQGWAVQPEPPGIDLEAEGFYRDPAASWQALSRRWQVE